MINLSKTTDYLLIYLLIAFSGVPFFYKAHIVMMIAFMVFPTLVFILRKRKIDRFIIYYISAVLLVQMGQMLKFYEFPLQTFLGLHMRILFAYLTIKAVGKKTISYYVDILVFSVIASLFFYLTSYISPIERFMENTVASVFDNPLIGESAYKTWPSVILYTFNSQGEGLTWLKRNSGPFWEPGAFSGFLMIALLLNIIMTGRLNNKKNRILMLGIFTTFSTSGIIVMGAVVVAYLVLDKESISRWVLLPLVFAGIVVSFFTIDFLGAKVIRKMTFTEKTYNTRFKSAQIDFYDFLEHPLLGMGRSQTTRFQGETDARTVHRNNGVSNHLVMYGAIVFIAYFYLMYLGFLRLCIHYDVDKRMALFSLFIIMLIGFSQIYFTKVFFIALTMLPVLFPRTKAALSND